MTKTIGELMKESHKIFDEIKRDSSIVCEQAWSSEYENWHDIIGNVDPKQFRQDYECDFVVESCLHDTCDECKGSGIKKHENTPCIHFISCPCPKCRLGF